MYTLLSTGDVPGASTYFNPLVQQSIISTTSAARPASPPDGIYIYETDTRLFRSWNSALTQWIVMGSNGPFSSTPQLTATTANPSLGTGAVRRGQYFRGPNGMVTFSFYLKAGTSPTTGTGQYLVDIPIAAASAFGGTDPEWWGVGRVTDSGTTTYNASFYIPGSNLNVVSIVIGGGVMGAGSPITLAVNDDIAGSITYRAAAGS